MREGFEPSEAGISSFSSLGNCRNWPLCHRTVSKASLTRLVGEAFVVEGDGISVVWWVKMLLYNGTLTLHAVNSLVLQAVKTHSFLAAHESCGPVEALRGEPVLV